jgi:hypothetical protein
MEWFRVEGVFPECEQVEDLIRRHPKQLEKAITLWLFLGCYCARNTTDGRISAFKMNSMVPTNKRPQAAVNALLDVGLLVKDGDYIMPTYLKYNPSKAEREKWRADNARRQAEYRERRSNALHNELVTNERNSVSNTPPVLTTPHQPDPLSNVPPPTAGERLPAYTAKANSTLTPNGQRAAIENRLIGKTPLYQGIPVAPIRSGAPRRGSRDSRRTSEARSTMASQYETMRSGVDGIHLLERG